MNTVGSPKARRVGTTRRTNRREERGAVLAIAAVSMSMLLVFAAFAVDLGVVYLHRQDDQSAVDLAAIAASQDRFVAADAATTAATSLNINLGTSFTPADMNTCSAIDMPAGWTTYPNYNCLAHDQSWTRLLLQVPTQSASTGFARLAGVTSIDHTAFAVVEVKSPQGGGVLPVIAFANAGSYQCLKVGAANVPDVQCSGANAGNFGLANFGQFGNLAMNTTPDCGGDGKDRMTEHLAMGLDHDVSRYRNRPHGTTKVIDTVSCGTIPAPNAVETVTGNVPNLVAHGLIAGASFPDGEPARLRRVDGLGWFRTTTVDSLRVDDTPLWEFLNPNLDASYNVPRSCWKDQFIGNEGGLNADKNNSMTNIGAANSAIVIHLLTIPVQDRMVKLIERCFDHYQGKLWTDHGAFTPGEGGSGCTGACSSPLFTRDTSQEFPNVWDIQLSPRFSYVPVTSVDPSTWNGNTGITIDSISPIFVQRVYAGNCSIAGCDIQFDPGHGYSSNKKADKVPAFTSFLFPKGTLPGGLDSPYAPLELGPQRIARLIR